MLTRKEEAWLRIFCSTIQTADLNETLENVVVNRAVFVADAALNKFLERFQ